MKEPVKKKQSLQSAENRTAASTDRLIQFDIERSKGPKVDRIAIQGYEGSFHQEAARQCPQLCAHYDQYADGLHGSATARPQLLAKAS